LTVLLDADQPRADEAVKACSSSISRFASAIAIVCGFSAAHVAIAVRGPARRQTLPVPRR